MPVQVIALIHWQALRLWLKRVPFHHKPAFVPGRGIGQGMSTVDRSLRGAPAAARLPLLERIAISVLERALARLEGGTLEVRLPGGQTRRFGQGAAASLAIHDDAFFRRIATRGKLGVGESYTAGEWDSDDLVALLELLLRNAAAAADRHAGWRRLLETRPRLDRRNGLLRARRNIAYHYDLGNDSSS